MQEKKSFQNSIIVILYPEAWDQIVCILTCMTINVTVVTQLLRPFKNSSMVLDLVTSSIRKCLAWGKMMDQMTASSPCKQLLPQWCCKHSHTPRGNPSQPDPTLLYILYILLYFWSTTTSLFSFTTKGKNWQSNPSQDKHLFSSLSLLHTNKCNHTACS